MCFKCIITPILIEAPLSYVMTCTGSFERITMPPPARSRPAANANSTPRESSPVGRGQLRSTVAGEPEPPGEIDIEPEESGPGPDGYAFIERRDDLGAEAERARAHAQ